MPSTTRPYQPGASYRHAMPAKLVLDALDAKVAALDDAIVEAPLARDERG
jgi:hypothetical protein